MSEKSTPESSWIEQAKAICTEETGDWNWEMVATVLARQLHLAASKVSTGYVRAPETVPHALLTFPEAL